MEFALDFKPTALAWTDEKDSNYCRSDPKLNRRHLLKLGVASMVAPARPGQLLHA